MVFTPGMKFAFTISYFDKEFKVRDSDYDEEYGSYEVGHKQLCSFEF